MLTHAPLCQPSFHNFTVLSTHSLPYTEITSTPVTTTARALGTEATQDVALFLAAFDELFKRMRKDGVIRAALPHVKAISASAQQHGSVFWGEEGGKTLEEVEGKCKEWLESNSSSAPPSFTTIPPSAFSRTACPIWMDNSTTQYCQAVTKGGLTSEKIANITGSFPTERFTGLQISKVIKETPDVYKDTTVIQLISTFMTTLFTGDLDVPMDLSDGCGMNLINLNTHAYDSRMLKSLSHGDGATLITKLPKPGVSDKVNGTAGTLLQSHLHTPTSALSPSTLIVSSSGDNLCTVAGLALREGDLAISLGTSDVIIGISRMMPPPSESCHTFINPCDPDTFVSIICASNGALSRNRLCEKYAGNDWARFDKLVMEAPAGNGGKIGIYCDIPETVPSIPKTGIYRYDCENGTEVDSEFLPAAECRAILESRALSFKLRAQSCGLTASNGVVNRIICTGGGANSPIVLQILADVFQCEVFVPEGVSNGAALGAAVRAAHGAFNQGSPRTRQVTFDGLCGEMLRSSMTKVAVADGVSAEVYNALIAGYDDFECEVQYKAGEWAAEREQKELERKAEERMRKAQKGRETEEKRRKEEGGEWGLLYVGVALGVALSWGAYRWAKMKR